MAVQLSPIFLAEREIIMSVKFLLHNLHNHKLRASDIHRGRKRCTPKSGKYRERKRHTPEPGMYIDRKRHARESDIQQRQKETHTRIRHTTETERDTHVNQAKSETERDTH